MTVGMRRGDLVSFGRAAMGVVFALLMAACGGTSGTLPPSGGPGLVDTRLGEGDSFEVKVYGEADLSGTYQIGQDGEVDFPFIGRVKVATLMPEQVADELEVRLRDGGFLKSPEVSVLVKEYRSKRVSVLGAVKNPGTFPLSAGMTVVQAISAAGGFTPLASRNDTVVTRKNAAGEPKRIRVAVDEVTAARAEDIELVAGDIVFVPERIF